MRHQKYIAGGVDFNYLRRQYELTPQLHSGWPEQARSLHNLRYTNRPHCLYRRPAIRQANEESLPTTGKTLDG